MAIELGGLPRFFRNETERRSGKPNTVVTYIKRGSVINYIIVQFVHIVNHCFYDKTPNLGHRILFNFDLYLNTAYAAQYIYKINITRFRSSAPETNWKNSAVRSVVRSHPNRIKFIVIIFIKNVRKPVHELTFINIRSIISPFIWTWIVETTFVLWKRRITYSLIAVGAEFFQPCFPHHRFKF